MQKTEAVVSWSGGKDCTLALYIAATRLGYSIQQHGLVTFVPSGKEAPKFLAHPIDIMLLQVCKCLFPFFLSCQISLFNFLSFLFPSFFLSLGKSDAGVTSVY